MTETQIKLVLTAGFAVIVGSLIAYQVTRNPALNHQGDDAGVVTAAGRAAPQAAMLDAQPERDPAHESTADGSIEHAPGAFDASLVNAGEGGASNLVDAEIDANVMATNETRADAGAGGLAHEAGAHLGTGEATGSWRNVDATATERAAILTFLAQLSSLTALPRVTPADAGALPIGKRSTIGQLLVPSGRLGIYDCMGHPYSDQEEVMIPAGNYAVDVLAESAMPTADSDLYAIVVNLTGSRAGSKTATLKQAFTLQSGSMMLCMASPESIKAFEATEQDAGTDLLIGIAHTDAGSRSWGIGAPPKSKLNALVFEAPAGRGPVYLGYDDRGHLVSIVVPLEPPPSAHP
jgi:hypothetical protein